jgi:hypothetical protein
MRCYRPTVAAVLRWCALLIWLVSAYAWAQNPGPQGPIMWSANCVGSPQMGGAYLCFDTTKNGFYAWNGTAFAPAANSSVWSGGSATIAQGATDYIAFGAQQTTTAQATQANAAMTWPVAGTASNLRCIEATAADNTTGNTFTVYGGSAGTTAEALTCSMSTAAGASTTACSDTTHTFPIAAGDQLDIKVVNGNTTAATGIVDCAFLVH